MKQFNSFPSLRAAGEAIQKTTQQPDYFEQSPHNDVKQFSSFPSLRAAGEAIQKTTQQPDYFEQSTAMT